MEIDVHLGGEPALVPFDRLRDVALDERDLLRCTRRSNRQTPEQDCQTCDKSEACPDTSRIPGDLQNKSGGKQRSKQIGRAHAELQSLMRISYAVFCLKKQKQIHISTETTQQTRPTN